MIILKTTSGYIQRYRGNVTLQRVDDQILVEAYKGQIPLLDDVWDINIYDQWPIYVVRSISGEAEDR